MHTYVRNIPEWLMPKRRRRCLPWPLIVQALKLYPRLGVMKSVTRTGTGWFALVAHGVQDRGTVSVTNYSGVGEHARPATPERHPEHIVLPTPTTVHDLL